MSKKELCTYQGKQAKTYVPLSVKAVEASSLGISIYRHDPKGKVAQAYAQVTEEVLYREN